MSPRAIGVEEMMSQLDTMFKEDLSKDGDSQSKGAPDDDFFIKLEEADKTLNRHDKLALEQSGVFDLITKGTFNSSSSPLQSHRSQAGMIDDSDEEDDEMEINAEDGTAENSLKDKDDINQQIVGDEGHWFEQLDDIDIEVEENVNQI